MIIAVPRERKELEKRVAITPAGVHQLCADGHTVIVEENAGIGSTISDSEFQTAGAKLVKNLSEVWRQADLLVKVKEPAPEEFSFFRENLTVFCFLHLASLPNLATALLDSKVTGIAYELVKTDDGKFPLLEPMSVVAGKLAVINGANCMLSQHGGRGMLLGGACGVKGASVVILGAGVAGSAALDLALEMGAEVTVLDINEKKIAALIERKHPRLKAQISSDLAREEAVTHADLLIGAALVPGARPPLLVSESLVKKMQPGAVIVDISIDQGGCIETIRPTSLSNPTYLEHGVIHYGVCNMPAQVPLTSTQALTKQTLPFIRLLAAGIESRALFQAINTQGGRVMNRAVAEALKLPYNSASRGGI